MTTEKNKGGRPSKYSKELALEFCHRLAEGRSLRKICSDADMPDAKTIRTWLGDEDKEWFLLQYKRAREEQAETYADEMDDLANNPNVDVARAKLIIDTRKWVASKLKPKKYGDKVDVNANVSGELKINVVNFGESKDGTE